MVELIKILLSTILNVLWSLVKIPVLIVVGLVGTAIGGSETPLLTCLIGAIAGPIKCLFQGISDMTVCVSQLLGNKVKSEVRRKIHEKSNNSYDDYE